MGEINLELLGKWAFESRKGGFSCLHTKIIILCQFCVIIISTSTHQGPQQNILPKACPAVSVASPDLNLKTNDFAQCSSLNMSTTGNANRATRIDICLDAVEMQPPSSPSLSHPPRAVKCTQPYQRYGCYLWEMRNDWLAFWKHCEWTESNAKAKHLIFINLKRKTKELSGEHFKWSN